jgi:hypothetical protein
VVEHPSEIACLEQQRKAGIPELGRRSGLSAPCLEGARDHEIVDRHVVPIYVLVAALSVTGDIRDAKHPAVASTGNVASVVAFTVISGQLNRSSKVLKEQTKVAR